MSAGRDRDRDGLDGDGAENNPAGAADRVVQFDAPQGGSSTNCTTRNSDSDAVAAFSGGVITERPARWDLRTMEFEPHPAVEIDA